MSTLLERSEELLLALVERSEDCACSFETVWTNINRYEHGSTADQVKRWKQRLFQLISEEVVTEQLHLASQADRRKISAQRRILLRWHVKPEDILPSGNSKDLSRNSLEGLARIAELRPSFDDARSLLTAQIETRMRAETGLRAVDKLMTRDILQVKRKLEEEVEDEVEAAEGVNPHITARKRRKKNKEDKAYAGSHLLAGEEPVQGRAASALDCHSVGGKGSELLLGRDDSVLSVEYGRGNPSGRLSNPAEFDSDISEDELMGHEIDSAAEEFHSFAEPKGPMEGETMDMDDLVNSSTFPQSAGPSGSLQNDHMFEEAPMSVSPEMHLEMDSSRSNQGRSRTTSLARSTDNVPRSPQVDGPGDAQGDYEGEGSLVGEAYEKGGDVGLDDGAAKSLVVEPPCNSRPPTTANSTEVGAKNGQSTVNGFKPAVDSSDLVASPERAIASLAPSQMLTSTAIQQLFDRLALPSCKVMVSNFMRFCSDPRYLQETLANSHRPLQDPSFLDESWKPRPIKALNPRIKMVLLPLHHRSIKHWNLACCYTADRTIKFYDSLPQQNTMSTREMVESFATSLCTHEAQWEFNVVRFSRQGNGVDCGLYVVLAGLYAMSMMPPPTDLTNCDCWRFVFRSILRGEVHEAEPECTALRAKSAVAEQSLECVSDGSESLAAMLSSDQTQLTALNATLRSLDTIKLVWEERVKQLTQSMQCVQTDVENAQHDKATYEAIREGKLSWGTLLKTPETLVSPFELKQWLTC